MDYVITTDTVHSLESMVASLTELLSVQEKVVSEQSERIHKDEEALRESEGRLKNLLENLPVGVLIIDAKNHHIIDANRKAVEMFGAPKTAIIGRVCHQFVCPAETGKCPITDLGQTVDDSERVLLTATGIRVPIIKTVIQAASGSQSVLIETFMDITDRKRAEEALKKSNERFLAFIREAAMRLKTPLEVVEENIAGIVSDVERGGCDMADVALQLKIQMKNLEQIRQNLIELNKAITEHGDVLSDATRKFLME